MPYCQLADIQNVLREDALLELTDDNNTGQVQEVVVTECIARADAMIDGYCAAKYVVPFGSQPGNIVPAIIRMLSEDLTIYNLYARRGENIPESVQDKNKLALGRLQDISKGLINLGVPAASAEEETEIGINTSSANRIFTNSNTPGVDPNASGSLDGY